MRLPSLMMLSISISSMLSSSSSSAVVARVLAKRLMCVKGGLSGLRSSFDYECNVSAGSLRGQGIDRGGGHTSSSAPVSSSELLSSSPMLTSGGRSLALPLPFPAATVWAGSSTLPPWVGSVLLMMAMTEWLTKPGSPVLAQEFGYWLIRGVMLKGGDLVVKKGRNSRGKRDRRTCSADSG